MENKVVAEAWKEKQNKTLPHDLGGKIAAWAEGLRSKNPMGKPSEPAIFRLSLEDRQVYLGIRKFPNRCVVWSNCRELHPQNSEGREVRFRNG